MLLKLALKEKDSPPAKKQHTSKGTPAAHTSKHTKLDKHRKAQTHHEPAPMGYVTYKPKTELEKKIFEECSFKETKKRNTNPWVWGDKPPSRSNITHSAST